MVEEDAVVAPVQRLARSPRLWQAVVEVLIERIVAGTYPCGGTLPTESALCEEFGVSRPSVREAMKVLGEKGLVRTRHGAGSVVQPPEAWSVLDPTILAARLASSDHDWEVFDELTVVRVALESELAALAAERADEATVERLRAHVALMDAAQGSPDAYLELDMAFHDLVMEASGNRMACAIMSSIEEALRESRRITNRIPRGVEHAHDFHTRIFRCVEQRDGPGAARQMREHLTWSWQQFRELRDTLRGAPADG